MSNTPADVREFQEDRFAELEGAPNYNRWQWRLASPYLGPRLLDIGAGTGYVTELFSDRERLVALEYDPGFAERLRERFAASPQVVVIEGDITSPKFVEPLRGENLDSAVSFNVFEHIEDDEAAFRSVYQVLKPGGSLVLFVPACQSIYGTVDADLGHHRRYSRKLLRARAQTAGFWVEVCHYVNLPGYFGWWFNARLLRSHGYVGGARAVGLWDRIVIPVAAAIERRLKPPFGQSLLLVARKP